MSILNICVCNVSLGGVSLRNTGTEYRYFVTKYLYEVQVQVRRGTSTGAGTGCLGTGTGVGTRYRYI